MLHDFMKDDDCLINYMIITGCHKTLEEMVEKKREDGKYDIVLTVNGVEMDLQEFMDRWQDNVDRLVEDKAEEIIREKFVDMGDVTDELSATIRSFEITIGKTIKKQIEKWEK